MSKIALCYATKVQSKIQFFSPVTCDALNLKNGHVSYTSYYQQGYPFDTVASFSCNQGYYLSRTEETTCQTTGKWNMDPPECTIGKEMNIVLRNEHSILISLHSIFP